MDRREIEKRLEDIPAKATCWLPASELADMVDLVQHGEPGIVLENFCTQLEGDGQLGGNVGQGGAPRSQPRPPAR